MGQGWRGAVEGQVGMGGDREGESKGLDVEEDRDTEDMRIEGTKRRDTRSCKGRKCGKTTWG